MNTSKTNTSMDQFVGSWALKEWKAEHADGQVAFPFGEDAKGRITYDASGNMAVQIMKNNRALFSSADPLDGEPDEVVSAYQGFIGYSGTYEVHPDSNQVAHHIDISSFPNWTGQVQKRYYEFREDQLILSTDFIGASRHQLIWEKMKD